MVKVDSYQDAPPHEIEDLHPSDVGHGAGTFNLRPGHPLRTARVLYAAGDSGAGLSDDEPALGGRVEPLHGGGSQGLAAGSAPLAR